MVDFFLKIVIFSRFYFTEQNITVSQNLNFRKCLHILCVLPYCCNHTSARSRYVAVLNERQTSDVECYTTLLFQ